MRMKAWHIHISQAAEYGLVDRAVDERMDEEHIKWLDKLHSKRPLLLKITNKCINISA